MESPSGEASAEKPTLVKASAAAATASSGVVTSRGEKSGPMASAQRSAASMTNTSSTDSRAPS